jgi:hypothetical protein
MKKRLRVIFISAVLLLLGVFIWYWIWLTLLFGIGQIVLLFQKPLDHPALQEELRNFRAIAPFIFCLGGPIAGWLTGRLFLKSNFLAYGFFLGGFLHFAVIIYYIISKPPFPEEILKIHIWLATALGSALVMSVLVACYLVRCRNAHGGPK